VGPMVVTNDFEVGLGPSPQRLAPVSRDTLAQSVRRVDRW